MLTLACNLTHCDILFDILGIQLKTDNFSELYNHIVIFMRRRFALLYLHYEQQIFQRGHVFMSNLYILMHLFILSFSYFL